MNNILSYLRKNRFYVLVVLVLLLSYSLSHLTNSIILILLPQNNNLEILTYNKKPKKINQNEEILSVDNYTAMVSGNFIRGKSKNIKQTTEPAEGTPSLQEKEEVVIDPEIQAKLEEENRKVESMKLSGILYSSYSPFSRATFVSIGKPSIEFKRRQKIGGVYFLRSIRKDYVVIRTDEFSFRVKINESISSAKEKEQKRIEERKAAQQALKEKEQTEPLVSSEKYTKVLSRVDIIRETKDITKIYQGAQFGPYFKDAVLEGYKIYSIRKDHIFYSLGARQGDIIKRINGISVDNVNKMMDIWNSLKNYDQITVDLDRKGKIVSFEFVIES